MPPSRSRPRPRKKSAPQLQTQAKAPPPLIRGILARWWGWAISFLVIVTTLWASVEDYAQCRPTVVPLSDSSAPTEFRVENKNPILDMTDAQLICDVESAAFDTDRGRIGFSFPVTSGAVNTAIPHRSAAHYLCDASKFVTFTKGSFCLMGLCNDRIDISPNSVRLASETLRIGMKYRILGLSLDYVSPSFAWDGHRWQEGPTLR